MRTFFPTMRCKRVKDVPLPKYAHDGDAGLDLCATEDVTLYPGESCEMGSGIAVAIPYGFAGFVLPRSGLGSKGLVIKMGTGVIDSTYRGEIGLTLMNNNPSFVWRIFRRMFLLLKLDGPDEPKGTIYVSKGDRVAQLVVIPVGIVDLLEVDELDQTERGAGGFGSSGISGGDRL